MNRTSLSRSGSPLQTSSFPQNLAAGVLLSLALGTFPALAGTPRVTAVYPAVAQRGAETEITFRGTNLADARNVLFDAPGFEVTSVKTEATQFVAKIKVPPEAAVGEHRCRVVTRSGIADLRSVLITPFPLVAEAKPKATAQSPQRIAPNTTVYGTTPNEDEDHYAVELQKGERLSIDVTGLQLQTGTPYDPEVSISTPSGNTLATVGYTTFGRGAPVYSTTVPEEGVYRISVRDATRNGIGTCQYVMHVGNFPRPKTSLPLGGPAGTPTDFTLIGDTLPLQITATPQADQLDFGSILPPDSNAPSPIPVRISSLPNVLEQTQSDSPTAATGPATPLPAAFNGLIEKPAQTDYFRFSSKKGQAWEFRVYARALRSPIDSVIEIFDAKGNRTGSNDDSGHPDSYLRWTAPAEGEFVLGIKDQLGRGGPFFTYRVEVSAPSPKVKVSLPEMTINNSQDRRALPVPKGNRYASLIRVKREDWSGALALQPLGLPPEVSATAGPIEKAFDTVAMVFEASENASPEQALIDIGGQSLEGPEAPVPAISGETKVSLNENGNQRAFYTVTESRFALAVTDPIPVKIDVVEAKTSVVRSGQHLLKIRVTRSDEFKGPFEITLLHAPPGLTTIGGVKVPEGVTEVSLPINATADAPLKSWKLCVIGSADFGKGPVWFSSGLWEMEVKDAPFAGTLVRAALPQSGKAQMKLKIEPKAGFEGKATVELLGLPLGVTAKPVEISPEDTVATFELEAAPNAQIGLNKQVIVQCTCLSDGVPTVSTCARGGILRVDRAETPKPASVSAAPAPTPASLVKSPTP